MILNKLDIPKRQAQCSNGHHPFQPGDKCYTLVSFEAPGWRRQDLCANCWDELKKSGLPLAVKSYWQAKVPAKEAAEALPKHKEARALMLLKGALASGSTADQREAYVLALYLARKKILTFRQEIEQLGESTNLYEINASEELLFVKKIALHPYDVDILQKRLAEMLTE